MRILTLAIAGTALTLAACSGGNEDSVANADLNATSTENLDQAASDAANDAANAEAAALGDQMNELNQADSNTTNVATTTDDQEQNVAGM